MGSFKYRQLCDIQFYHAYFDNGISRKSVVQPVSDLDIALSPETARLFHKHRLRCYYRQPNGVSIYGEVDKGAGNLEYLSAPLRSTDKWVFVVLERNQDYRLWSDMPMNLNSSDCLYLTNATGNQAAAPDGLHLTKSADKADWQTDLISLHTIPAYTYDENGPLQASQAILSLQNSAFQMQAERVLPGKGTSQAVFNLQNAPSGLYTLQVKGSDKAIFYFLNGAPRSARPMAVIEIYWNNTVTDNYLWQNADGSLRDPTPAYRINLAARNSIWKYRIAFGHLQDTDQIPAGIFRDNISNLSISSDPAGDQFVVEQETDNRRFLVAAQQPLPWHETPQRRLTLSYDLNNQAMEREPLPHPTPESLQTDTQSNQLISSIIINQ